MATKKEIDLSDFVPERKGPGCTIPEAIKKLEKVQREKVELAFKSPEISHTMIAKRLGEWSGSKILGQTVSRHRNGICSCRQDL